MIEELSLHHCRKEIEALDACPSRIDPDRDPNPEGNATNSSTDVRRDGQTVAQEQTRSVPPDAIEAAARAFYGHDGKFTECLRVGLEAGLKALAKTESEAGAWNKAIEAAALVAEAMPKLREISPKHVRGVTPQDVAAEIRKLASDTPSPAPVEQMGVREQTKSCSTCAMYEGGRCHDQPPVRLPRKFVSTTDRHRSEEIEWGWPEVAPTDFCGKWQPTCRSKQ